MKKILVTMALVATTALTTYGQGRIGFDNLGTGNAVTIEETGEFVGADFSVQLVWAPQGTYATQAAFDAAILGSSGPIAFFGVTGLAPAHGPTADGAGLFDGGNVAVAVGTYTVQARAWFNGGQYATFDAANGNTFTGRSLFQDIASTAAPTPANFTAFAPFTVTMIPEPTTFALTGLGAASLLLFRRRK